MSWTRIWGVGSGGFTNQVMGAKALGMGNAFTAVADDPTAIFFNPAGLSWLPGLQVSAGLTSIFPQSKYTNTAGLSTEMSDFIAIVPNLYATWSPADSRWSAGIGVYSPFGLKTVWPHNGPFRYIATESELTILQYAPVLSFKVSENFSLGTGLAFTTGRASLKSAIDVTSLNFLLGGIGIPADDGQQELEGEGTGIGANAGLLYRNNAGHSFGVNYRSDVKIDIEGQTRLRNLFAESAAVFGGSDYSVDTETSLSLPPTVTLGYAFRRGPWTVAVDGEWAGYSSHRKTHLTFSGEADATRLSVLNFNNPIERTYKDRWSFGLGANYLWNQRWQTRAGYFFYPSVVPDQTWDPSVPDSDTHGAHLGGAVTLGAVTLDLTYSFLKFTDLSIDNDVGAASGNTVDGQYETSAQFAAFNVTYRFTGARP